MDEEKIQKFAKKAGFLRAEYKGTWKDYKVYEPIYSDDKETYFICEPWVILVKGKKIRRSNGIEEINDIIENITK